jgi:hypothetical protein
MAASARIQRAKAWVQHTTRFLLDHPGSLAVVLGALLLGGAAGWPVGDETFRYLWADDRFCNDCHVHDYANEAFEKSVHQGFTTCHDCHLVPIRHYPRNLFVTLLAPPQGPEDIPPPEIDTVICVRCHSAQAAEEHLTGPMSPELRPLIVKIDDSPGHRVHLGSTRRDPTATEDLPEDPPTWSERHGTRPDWDAGRIGCADCHGGGPNRAHRFEATAENCLQCHEQERPHAGDHTMLDCRSCHFAEFVAP